MHMVRMLLSGPSIVVQLHLRSKGTWDGEMSRWNKESNGCGPCAYSYLCLCTCEHNAWGASRICLVGDMITKNEESSCPFSMCEMKQMITWPVPEAETVGPHALMNLLRFFNVRKEEEKRAQKWPHVVVTWFKSEMTF